MTTPLERIRAELAAAIGPDPWIEGWLVAITRFIEREGGDYAAGFSEESVQAFVKLVNLAPALLYVAEAAQAHLNALERHNSKYAPGPPPWPIPQGTVADTSRRLADALAGLKPAASSEDDT